jgi:hypothetical protein
MIYLKSLLLGVAGAISASILWVVIAPLVLWTYLQFQAGRTRGAGGLGSASIGSGSVLIAAIIGFVIASAWEWRRLRVT